MGLTRNKHRYNYRRGKPRPARVRVYNSLIVLLIKIDAGLCPGRFKYIAFVQQRVIWISKKVVLIREGLYGV